MYVNVLVRRTICDTSTICKIHENANFTNRTFVAQIELSQIEGSICQIERSICETTNMIYESAKVIKNSLNCVNHNGT